MALEQFRQFCMQWNLAFLAAFGRKSQVLLCSHTDRAKRKAHVAPEQVHYFLFAKASQQKCGKQSAIPFVTCSKECLEIFLCVDLRKREDLLRQLQLPGYAGTSISLRELRDDDHVVQYRIGRHAALLQLDYEVVQFFDGNIVQFSSRKMLSEPLQDAFIFAVCVRLL